MYLCTMQEKYSKVMHHVLCINGSDSMGLSGIQSDIRTIKDLGGTAMTAITSVTVQNSTGIQCIHELPTDMVLGQIKAVYDEIRPDAVKVGMVNNPQTIKEIRDEICGCPCIVCSPGILSSYGGMMMGNDAIAAFRRYMLPICTILIIKCTDAEILLGHRISTEASMLQAIDELQDMGAGWILLRGGVYTEGRIGAVFAAPRDMKDVTPHFFSSVNVEGWQRHGVGGTLSTAVAMRMAMGDDPQQAISHAHTYMHSQVVYKAEKPQALQPHALYERFMTLVADNYRTAHNVAFYAKMLSISARYLSQITHSVSGNTPKQTIAQFIIRESEEMLNTTNLNIQQISDEMGFPSQIAFAKFFRANRGLSPTEYRRRH